MRPIVKSIYDRHTAALHGVTAGSTWIDHAAASLSLWLALDELDAHHIGINPATNGSIGRWRKLEEDLLTLLDETSDDGEYAGDPVDAVRRLFADGQAAIFKLATCVDEQAVIIEDLRQKLRQAQAAQLPPTVHVNGNGALSAASTPAAMPSVTFTVTPADEVDYPPTTAAKLPATRVNWLGLPVDLQTRILQMDAGDQAVLHLLGQDPDLPQQFRPGGGDQGGDHRGGAVPPVQLDRGLGGRDAGLRERPSPAAVHMHVHEPGDDGHRAQVTVGRLVG